MIQVDLTAIHRIMTKYYGSRHMKMDTIVENRNFIRPKELKITFDYDPLCHVDMLRLHRRLGKHIDGVRELFVSVNNNKIEIHVVLYRGRKLRDYDFEFSVN
jgi:hypothetical protein